MRYELINKKENKQMNIIEAVKSGKRFRRKLPSWGFMGNPGEWSLDNLDILATDWEIEEKKIEITESEFWKAYGDALKHVSSTAYTTGADAVIDELKKRLFNK